MAKKKAPLTDRTAQALAWRFTSKVAAFGLRLLVVVLLARLVSVDAFGLVAQALLVINLAGLVSEIGMGPAVVQRRALTPTHIRVAFTVSVLSGLALMALVWCGAPLVAAAFRSPEVVPILRLVSGTCLLTSLATTAGGLLQRQLAFRRLFVADFLAYLLGYGVVGVGLALGGYGVWALAWAPLTEAGLRAGLYFAAQPHSLRPSLARAEARQLFRFGTGMTLARVANYVAFTADNFVVGRQLGAAALGLYGRAFQLMSLPIAEFSDVIGTVLFPAYAEIQDQRERLRRAFLASVSISALVVFPLLTALALAAPELVTGVFGAQWAGAIVPLQVLCLGGGFRAIYNLGDSVARACGAVYSQSWRHAVYAGCVLTGAIVGCRWGITGVAAGVVGALAVMYLLMAHLTLRLTGTGCRAFLAAQLPGMLLAAGAVGAGVPVMALLRAASLPQLVILAGTLLGALAAAAAVGFLLPRSWHDPKVLAALQRLQRQGAVALGSLWLRWRQGTVSSRDMRPGVAATRRAGGISPLFNQPGADAPHSPAAESGTLI